LKKNPFKLGGDPNEEQSLEDPRTFGEIRDFFYTSLFEGVIIY